MNQKQINMFFNNRSKYLKKVEDLIIEEAKRNFPNSLSDVEAVKNYAGKVFNELKQLRNDHPDFSNLKTLYINLIRLNNDLHRANIEKMSMMIRIS